MRPHKRNEIGLPCTQIKKYNPEREKKPSVIGASSQRAPRSREATHPHTQIGHLPAGRACLRHRRRRGRLLVTGDVAAAARGTAHLSDLQSAIPITTASAPISIPHILRTADSSQEPGFAADL